MPTQVSYISIRPTRSVPGKDSGVPGRRGAEEEGAAHGAAIGWSASDDVIEAARASAVQAAPQCTAATEALLRTRRISPK